MPKFRGADSIVAVKDGDGKSPGFPGGISGMSAVMEEPVVEGGIGVPEGRSEEGLEGVLGVASGIKDYVLNAGGVDVGDGDGPDDLSPDFESGQDGGKPPDRIDRRSFDLRSLDIEVDGKTVAEHIRPLCDFFDQGAVSHTEARQVLRDCLPGFSDDAFDYPRFLEKIGPANFYSSSKIRGRRRLQAKDDAVAYLPPALRSKWQKKGAVFLKFLLLFPSLQLQGGRVIRKGPEDIALQFPRMLDLKKGLKDLGLDIEISPRQAIALQVMFSSQCGVAIRNGKDHRKAYFLAQLAVLVANAACAQAKADDEDGLAHPSLDLVDRFEGKPDQARNFVKARLSLLLPDKSCYSGSLVDGRGKMKKIVQEDFITADLIEFTKKVGLYDEFEPIFGALKSYRQMQFMRTFHLDKESHDPLRRSILQVLEDFERQRNRKPVVADFGGGNGLLAKLLYEKGLVERIISVDKHDGERVEEVCCGGAVKIVKLKDHGLERRFDELRREVVEKLGQADVVIAGDSLHESDSPAVYVQALYEKVLRPGGVLYISDPSHCEDLDDVTRVALHPYDSTKHPSSMLSWEQYLKILSYLSVKGVKITGIGVVPGSLAGYSDALWRLSLALQKPAQDGKVPYKIHEAEGFDSKVVQKPEDVFQVWPVSLIPEEAAWREKFLSLIHPVRSGISFSEVRRFVITRLLTVPPYTNVGTEGKGLRKRLSRAWSRSKAGWHVMRRAFFDRPIHRDFINDEGLRPYHDDLRDLLAQLDLVDEESRSLNSRAGEAMAIERLLIEKLDLDIKSLMRESPGWQNWL